MGTYRNVTLDVNFGPVSHCPLPFKCNMVSDAATDDIEMSKVTAPRKNEKAEVLLPVGLPDKGYFDYIDEFLEKNPSYTELSDRKVIDWIAKSGISKPKNTQSNDKPSMNFGVPMLEDGSVQKVIKTCAPMAKRNFVVAELKSNLVGNDRKKTISFFKASHFKKSAVVFMGKPSAGYKAMVQKKLLKSKQAKADAERKKKAAE